MSVVPKVLPCNPSTLCIQANFKTLRFQLCCWSTHVSISRNMYHNWNSAEQQKLHSLFNFQRPQLADMPVKLVGKYHFPHNSHTSMHLPGIKFKLSCTIIYDCIYLLNVYLTYGGQGCDSHPDFQCGDPISRKIPMEWSSEFFSVIFNSTKTMPVHLGLFFLVLSHHQRFREITCRQTSISIIILGLQDSGCAQQGL